MKDDARPDYRRVRPAALQALARGGDTAATQELERRGLAVEAAVNVAALAYDALRELVLAWRDGIMPADRDRSRALAFDAQAELEARYRADSKLWDGCGDMPTPPPAPPWRASRAPRCVDWRRPSGSTVYPSEADVARAQFGAIAKRSS